jgi:hypothetical protein
MRPTPAALALTALIASGMLAARVEGTGQYYQLNTEAELNRWVAHDPAVTGALDIHFHGDPDSNYDRNFVDETNPEGRTGQFDILDAAKIAKASGMRGFVFKSKRLDPTPLAYLARKLTPGLEVFAAMSMDRPFRMNPEAVNFMANVEGGWGRVIFMVAEDAAVQGREPARSVPVSKNGELLPETKAVISLIAKTRTRGSNGELVMATGHNSPSDCLLLVHEASRMGVKHMVLTHPGADWTIAQLQEAVNLGAYVEITALSSFVPVERQGGKVNPVTFKRAMEVIRAIGPDHIIVSTDMGRMHSGAKLAGNPTSPQAFALAAKVLRAEGITERQISTMFKDNPARLLGLPVLSGTAAHQEPGFGLGQLFVKK